MPTGAILTITGQARDNDGQVVRIEFRDGANSLGTLGTNELSGAGFHTCTLAVSNLSLGYHLIQMVAVDDEGAFAFSQVARIWAEGSMVVTNTNTPPLVSLTILDGIATERPAAAVADTAVVRVRRIGDTSRALNVNLRMEGDALAGVDYEPLPATITIPVGAEWVDLVVSPIDDGLAEPAETVSVTLLLPSYFSTNAGPGSSYRLGFPYRATVCIIDNDHGETNHPPAVAITSPASGVSFSEPASITLLANAQDLDGLVRRVEFFADGTRLGAATNNPNSANPAGLFSLRWANVLAGNHSVIAVATDDQGATAGSGPVELSVIQAPTNGLPVVSIVASDAFAAEGSLPLYPTDYPGMTNLPAATNFTNTASFGVRRRGGDLGSSQAALSRRAWTWRFGLRSLDLFPRSDFGLRIPGATA